jgi:hypothetical protein
MKPSRFPALRRQPALDESSGMHLLYVDESGDTGRHNPQNHTFVLCGLMVHHADWHEARSDLLEMRDRMEQIFGLPKAAEIHASELLGRSPSRFGLDRTARIKAALHQVEMIRRQGSLFAVRVIVDKRRLRGDILTTAWHQMLSAAKSVATSSGHARCSSPGIIVICDDHRTAPGSGWLDSVQKSLDMESILLDQPFGRDSRASDFLQACDMLAYLTKQTVEPAGFFSRNNSRWLVERCERMFGERGLSFHPEWKGGA